MALDRSSRLDYSGLGCQCRLNKGGLLFRRTATNKEVLGSKNVREVPQYGCTVGGKTTSPESRYVARCSWDVLERYPSESAGCAAADALRLTINYQAKRKNLQKTTVNILWEHYCREELPLKEISTQDAYLVYATERAKHWRARQCETSEVSLSAVTRRSQTRSGAAGISRPASRVVGGLLGNPSRGTWGTALAGLRVRKHEFQCATFLLLASGWAPEEHKNGSVGKAFADASESEAGLAGMEVTKSLQPAGRFRLPFGETEGQQTTRLGFGVEEKDSTGVQEDRHHGSELAHISAHGGNYAGRDGRTPTNDPRLLTPREFARNQQVSSGNDNEQAFGTRKAGGRHFARGRAIGKQINSGPLGSPRGNLIGPKWTQIVFGGSA